MRELAISNPADFIAAFPDGAIIDEAQKVPEIFDALKLHIDSTAFTPGKFILTGSSQFRLRKNMTDSLAGRAAFLKLLPLSIQELKNAGMLPDNPYDFIYNGQYPPSAAGKSGHSDVKTTVTYTYTLNKGPADVTSPLDKL